MPQASDRQVGRFHYFEGRTLARLNAFDRELLKEMMEATGVSAKELTKPERLSRYAMGVLTVEGDTAILDLHWKRADPHEPEFNLAPDVQAEAEAEFQKWAAAHGYEPKLKPGWATDNLR